MTDPKQQEPSMEEILASIRRIISEDDTEPKPSREAAPEPAVAEIETQAAPAAADDDDVLLLTDVVEDEPVAQPLPTGDVDLAPANEGDMMAAPEPVAPAFDPAPAAEEPAAWEPAAPVGEDDTLVSSATAAAATAALARLTEPPVEPARGPVNPLPMGNSGQTLEEIVRDLLRPMLRNWLDANLPTIVEQAVAREVERMRRDATKR